MDELFSQLANFMNSIGLGSLFTIDSEGNPSGWLWEQVQNGVSSKETLMFSLEQTPEFQRRFPVINEQRTAAGRGEPVTVMTPQQVLEYEQVYRDTMIAAGVPSWFYDSYEDAHRAIRANIAPTQIEARVARGITAVKNMPSEVRDVFAEFYGSTSEDALLAAVLDPQKTLSELDRSVVASTFAGSAREQGMNISRQQAEQYAGLADVGTRSAQDVRANVQSMVQLRPLAESQMGEASIGDTTDVAFRAGALGDVATSQQLERRLRTRQQGQQTSAGGAMVGQSGVTGV